MSFKEKLFPLELLFSLEKLGAFYKSSLTSENVSERLHAETVVTLLNENPELVNGIGDIDKINDYQSKIDIILADLFPKALLNNEIKIATMPFHESAIKGTSRFKNILKDAGDDFLPEIKNFAEDNYYIMGCSIILQQYYNYNIDFRRPFYYEIPDKNGMMRHYRIVYNGDYIDIVRKEDTPAITEADVDILLDNFTNIALWKEKFPPNSYQFKGFVLANLFDATADVSISNFKSELLQYDDKEEYTDGFRNIFRSIFNLKSLDIGVSNYDFEHETFELAPYKEIKSYLLNGQKEEKCTEVLCSGSYDAVFNTGNYFTVSDVARHHKEYPEVKMYKNLYDQGIRSIIIAPIRHKNTLLGMLEITSSEKGKLNSINANKLEDVMPYLVETVLQSKEQLENEIDLIIQTECTSIHKSVYWKFEKEARRFLKRELEGDTNTQFRDVVFRDVYPLFGQIDIKGSSDNRNHATQQDILLQLTNANAIVKEAYLEEELPIYQQLSFNLEQFIKEVEDHLDVDTERTILAFLKKEIKPLFSHLKRQSDKLAKKITTYRGQLEDNLGLVYNHRKDYDESVMLINKKLAAVLDKKQQEAQKMYPHFFEVFKTDGVEHNMYIGESITKGNSFNKIYLYNLRLWQLQVMCEMENVHFKLSQKLSRPLGVASMILVFNTSLSVRYRMDEKRFDVDGTYNARYEIVKKRVDKAYIKDTEERITQAGKMTIVYSQKSDEREYLRYIEFLQTKKYLGTEVEVLELEDLQAVTGLKAIRVNVLYAQEGISSKKEFFTYEDLINTLES